jgi:hypothetical protein
MFEQGTVPHQNKCREVYFKDWLSKELALNIDKSGFAIDWIDNEVKMAKETTQPHKSKKYF